LIAPRRFAATKAVCDDDVIIYGESPEKIGRAPYVCQMIIYGPNSRRLHTLRTTAKIWSLFAARQLAVEGFFAWLALANSRVSII
jgi:hypothetical protein